MDEETFADKVSEATSEVVTEKVDTEEARDMDVKA